MAEVLAKGIDISSHQTGNIDFEQVKAAGYSYVIIKAGQGLREFVSFKTDPQYHFLQRAQAAGLDWGAYWWSDAVTVEEAKAEAQAFIKALDGLKPTYPVWMDQEYESPCGKWGVGAGKQLRTDMAKAFLQTMQDAGYYAGLYASKNWLENWVDAAQLTAYDKWVAQYAGRCTYAGAYGMWQHHGDLWGFVGHCPGVNTPVDLNDCYRDYPGIIKANGLNGWGKPVEPPAEDMTTIQTKTYNALCERARAADEYREKLDQIKRIAEV